MAISVVSDPSHYRNISALSYSRVMIRFIELTTEDCNQLVPCDQAVPKMGNVSKIVYTLKRVCLVSGLNV